MSTSDDVASASAERALIRTVESSHCYLCGNRGELLYSQLEDRLFQAPGSWGIRRCSDRACALLWLDPVPIEEDLAKAYEVYYTHAEQKTLFASRQYRLYRALRDAYVRCHYDYAPTKSDRLLSPLVSLHPGVRAEADFDVLYQARRNPATRLLDIGCGSGAHLQYLANLGWREAEGIDSDPRAVAAAVQRGLRVRNSTTLDFDDLANSFDIITASHVIEHVRDPVAMLTECHRLLKPGGSLLLLTPNAMSWCHSLFGASWLHLDPPRHLFVFNESNLRTALTRSGQWASANVTATIRGAAATFDASLDIRKTGRHTRSFFATNLFRATLAHTFSYAESTLNRFTLRGEEILVRARKPE